MLPSALFRTFHNNNNKRRLQIHITQPTELAAWRNRKQFKGTRSPSCLRKHSSSRDSLIWGRNSSEALGLRDIDRWPSLFNQKRVKGCSLKKGSPLGPSEAERQDYGKGTHPEALPWLVAQAEEEFKKGHSSMAVGRSLTLATFFLSTRIFQSTAAPTPSGVGKKEQL